MNQYLIEYYKFLGTETKPWNVYQLMAEQVPNAWCKLYVQSFAHKHEAWDWIVERSKEEMKHV